jgi:hypothetical protein
MYKLHKIINLINRKYNMGFIKITLRKRPLMHVGLPKNPKYSIQFAINKYGFNNFFSIKLLEKSTERTRISDLEDPTTIKHSSRAQKTTFGAIFNKDR